MFALFRKWLMVGLTMILIGGILLLSPWGLTTLSNHFGQPYLLSVERVALTFQPFGVTLKQVRLGKGDGALTLTQLDFRLNPSAFFGGVPELTIVGDRLAVAYQGDEPSVAGLSLTEWQKKFLDDSLPSKEKVKSKAPHRSDDKAPSALPALIVPSIRFAEIKLQSERAGWPNVTINNVQLGAINTQASEQASGLSALINTAKGKVLLSGYFYPLAKLQHGALDLELQHVQPSHRWFKYVPETLKSANINAKLKVQWQQLADQSNPDFNVQGDLQFKTLHWQQLEQELQLASLMLNGFSLDPERLNLSSLSADKLKFSLDIDSGTQAEYQFDQLNLSDLDIVHWQQTDQFKLQFARLGIQQQQLQYEADKAQSLKLDLQKLALSAFELNPNHLILDEVSSHQLVIDITDFVNAADTDAPVNTNRYQLQTLILQQLNVIDWRTRPHIQIVQLNLADGELSWQRPKVSTVNQPVASSHAIADTKPLEHSVNTQVSQDEAKPVELQVQQINIQRQTVMYQDHNLPRPTQNELRLESLQVEHLHWPSTESVRWQLDAWLDGQSHWLLSGTLQPTPLAFTAKGSQNGLSLPSVSPYSEQAAQVYFLQGVMDNQIELTLEKEHLEGTIGFLFHQLDMSLKGDFASQNLPLQMALSILEDSDQKIELKIGVDKKGDALKVNSGDVIREFILSASQKGALSYLKYTLQPFGSLMTLKSLGESLLKGGAIPLDPVYFQPLQAELSAQQKAYADKISTVLKERSGLKLTSCMRGHDAEYQRLLEQYKGDAKLSQKAWLTLDQGRLRQWRRVIASHGVSHQLKACDLSEKALNQPPSSGQAMLILKLAP